MEIKSEDLREQIIEMSALTEKILESSFNKDIDLKEIYKIEDDINIYHKKVDDNVFKFIALKNPIARDLRMALCAMKINAELERMADQAVSIRRYYTSVNRKYPLVENMITEVLEMVKNSIDSFVKYDTRKATDVIKNDQGINDINKEVIKTFLSRMKSNELSFDEGFAVIRVAKNLERVGDLTTNIAEDVIFLVSGDDIRHGGGSYVESLKSKKNDQQEDPS